MDGESQGSQEISISEFISRMNEMGILARELIEKIVEDSEVRAEVVKSITTENLHNFTFLRGWLEMTLEIATISKVLSIMNGSTEEGMSLREEISAWAQEAGLGDDVMISLGMPPRFDEE